MPSFEAYLDRITIGDSLTLLGELPPQSIHCFISDIPYGISQDSWDVLHPNTNSALLGQSPAQVGKSGFKRRGKPIRGWSAADREIPRQYEEWCYQWGNLTYPTLKDGASLFVFGARRTLHRAIVALEDSGFLLKDVLVWEKPNAHHRAQQISGVLAKRGAHDQAEKWRGWRLGNLAPIWEPIAWFFKPYPATITDVVIQNEVGAINIEESYIDGKSPENILRFGFDAAETRFHEAQKPLALIEFLIRLTTRPDHIILDPFAGSGTTALAAKKLGRHFVAFEINPTYAQHAETRLKQSSDSAKTTDPKQGSLF